MAKLVKNNKQEMSLFNHVVKAVIEIKISFFFLIKYSCLFTVSLLFICVNIISESH